MVSEENHNDDDDGNSSSEVVRLETVEETADVVIGQRTVNTVTSKMTVDSREASFEKWSITERQLIGHHHQSSYSGETVDSSNNVTMTNSIQDNSDLFDT